VESVIQGGPPVITKRRCPHTGIVNFYGKADPLLAIGSVSEGVMPAQYIWRSYLDDRVAGVAPDRSIAEASLRDAIARAQDPNQGLI
jgi:hypothetical protein